MKKVQKMGEVAYILGIPLLAVAVIFLVKADLGISMVVAPAYLISLKFPWLSFGMAEYLVQALLLLAIIGINRRFHLSFLFSFVTALYYGLVLDFFIYLMQGLEAQGLFQRLLFYGMGITLGSMAISLIFHSYLSPLVYELFVKEVAKRGMLVIHHLQMFYDCSSLLVAVVLSLVFFGGIQGIGLGTLVAALVNGWIIGQFSRFFDQYVDFSPRTRLNRFFT